MKPEPSTKNVLVTGGAGFIGSHLVDRLVADGCRVLVLDNLTKGRIANVRQQLDCERFGLETGDIRDEAVLRRVLDRGPFDVLYHLAAMHYIPECMAQPAETLSVNVVGTQALLSAISCRRFVFASTGDVYTPKDGQHQEGDPLEPWNIYGLSKLFGERLLEATSGLQKETTFVVARLFNVYGPRETNPHLIPRVLEEARRGTSIRLGNLWPRRDYTYVEDTADALGALGELEVSSRVEHFNVGTGVTASVEDVVKLFEDVLGTRLDVKVDPERARPEDRPHLQADIGRIQRATGWQPRYSLRDGLKELCVSEGLVR